MAGRFVRARHWEGLAHRLLLVWAGLSLGVAFLATPAKFLAPSLDLTVALDVGRQTFRVYNQAELVLLLVLTVLGFLSARRRWMFALIAPGVIVIVQALWLIPALDARVAILLAGGQPAPSNLHAVYIMIEAAKVGALLWCGFRLPAAAATRG